MHHFPGNYNIFRFISLVRSTFDIDNSQYELFIIQLFAPFLKQNFIQRESCSQLHCDKINSLSIIWAGSLFI